MRDMRAKGRNPRVILTKDQVHWIRASRLTAPVMADWLGVSEGAVYKARSRQTWKHI